MIFKEADPRKLNINKHELSVRMAAPCDLEDGIFAKLYDELLLIAKPAYVAVRVELAEQNGGISIGKFNSSSKALIKLCQGCSSCIAFVATLGIGVDRLIFKRAQISKAEAFMIDAISDALVEALCDLAEEELSQGLMTNGRFSPGYSDIELSIGAELLALTTADKALGIKLTESGLMVPKKSVNALIPIKDV